MRYWFSPFPLGADILTPLAEANLEPWPAARDGSPEEACLLVYDSPDRLISVAAEPREEAVALSVNQLVGGYLQLFSWARALGHPLLAGWQVRELGASGLRQWLEEGDDGVVACPVGDGAPAAIPPLLAAVTLGLLEAEPQLLEAYLDLELHAKLLGRQPDLNYRQRLHQASDAADALLHGLVRTLRMPADLREMEQRLTARETELGEAKEAGEATLLELHQVQEALEGLVLRDQDNQRQAEAQVKEIDRLRETLTAERAAHQRELAGQRQRLEPRLAELQQRLTARETELGEAKQARETTLLELHQVQEALEGLVLADRDNQRQAEAQAKEIDTLRETLAAERAAHQRELAGQRQRLEPRLAELERRLTARETDLREARQEAELTAWQLHQVQEELEHQFLTACASQQLVAAQIEQLQRAQLLLARMQGHGSPGVPTIPTVAVEVLPAMPSVPSRPQSLQTDALLSTYSASLKRANDLLERARRSSAQNPTDATTRMDP
ncbi:MAG: hypothetical protein ACK5QW_01765 [Cyanobacteriota bacterium]|jgi:ribosomal silencing factor RsfS